MFGLTRGLMKEAQVETSAIGHGLIVKMGSTDDLVTLATAATDSPVGVSFVEGNQNTVSTAVGDVISVQMTRIAEVRYGGTVTRGQNLVANSVGRAIAVTSNSGVQSIGKALTSGVAGDFGYVLLNISNQVSTAPISNTTVSTLATAGVETYTAAQLLGGLILRDPNGAGRNDVTPTAAQIVAAIAGAAVGHSFEFTIRNTADAAETITVTAGAGVTLSGTMTIAQNNTKRFLAVLTNVGSTTEAVTIYSIGTFVH